MTCCFLTCRLLPSKAADIAKDNFVSAYEGRDDDKEKKTRPKNE